MSNDVTKLVMEERRGVVMNVIEDLPVHHDDVVDHYQDFLTWSPEHKKTPYLIHQRTAYYDDLQPFALDAAPRIKQEDSFSTSYHDQRPYDIQLLQGPSPTFSPPRSYYSPYQQQLHHHQQQLHHHHQQQQQQQQQQQLHHASFANYRINAPNMHSADLAPDAVDPLAYHPQGWVNHPPQDPFDLDHHDPHAMAMASLDMDPSVAVDMNVAVADMMDMDGIVVVSGGMPVGLAEDPMAMAPSAMDVNGNTVVAIESGPEQDAEGDEDWESHTYQQQQQQQYIDAYHQVQQPEEELVDTIRATARSQERGQGRASDGEGEEQRRDSIDQMGANDHSHTTRRIAPTHAPKSPLSQSSLSSISNASDEEHNLKAEADEELSTASEEDDEEDDPEESPSSEDDYDDDNDPEFVLNTRSRPRRTTTTRRGTSANPSGQADTLSYPGAGGPASYPNSGSYSEGRNLRSRAASARVRYTPYPANGFGEPFYDAQGNYSVDSGFPQGRARYASTGSLSSSLDGDAGGSSGRSAGQATPQAPGSRAQSMGSARGSTRSLTSVPIPIPVPNLTKKSRGRRVPTMESLEDLRSAASGAGRKRQGPAGKGARMYLCEVEGCGKCFARGEHLKRHVRSIHTYEKPHKCMFPGCGKDFSRHDNLGQHMRVHKNYVPPERDSSSASTASPAPENARRRA